MYWGDSAGHISSGIENSRKYLSSRINHLWDEVYLRTFFKACWESVILSFFYEILHNTSNGLIRHYMSKRTSWHRHRSRFRSNDHCHRQRLNERTNAKKQEGSATTKEAKEPQRMQVRGLLDMHMHQGYTWAGRLLASRGPTTLSFVFAVKFKECIQGIGFAGRGQRAAVSLSQAFFQSRWKRLQHRAPARATALSQAESKFKVHDLLQYNNQGHTSVHL